MEYRMSKALSVIVVGAGIAGLSAAWDLRRAGHSVVVLERAGFAGGRMADRVVNGLNVHTGASILFTFYEDMLGLIRKVGLEPDLVTIPGDRSVTCDNGSMTYPLRYKQDVAFLLGHPAFGAMTKARLATLLPEMIAAGLTTDPNLMHTAVRFDDETMADYVRRRVGEDFLENYVEPLFRGPWHWEPEEISRAYLLSILGHLSRHDLATFRQGIGALTRKLAAGLDVRTDTAVSRVEESEGRVTVALADGRSMTADIVVLAVQGNKVAGLIGGTAALRHDHVKDVRYTPGARVYYSLKRAPANPRNLRFTRRNPSAISFYDEFAHDRIVPEGHVQPPYLQAELTPQTRDRMIAEGGTANPDRYARDAVRALYPDLERDLDAIVEQYWDEMLPQWHPGYARKVADFLARQEKVRRRVYACGDYLAHSHTGGACASGRRTARLVLGHWSG
jgi:oxygen-dependent protoporphyrinogen oxidase